MFVHNTNQNTFNFNDSCYARKVLPIQGQQRHKLAIVWKHASYAQSRERRIPFCSRLIVTNQKKWWATTEDWSATDRRLIGERSPTILCLQKCRRLVWFSMLQRIPLADQTVLTTNRRLVGDHRQSFADHRKPPKTIKKKVVVGGRREVVDVILWQPLADWSATIIDNHLPTSDNLRQPPQKSGCQRSATGCRYSVTGALERWKHWFQLHVRRVLACSDWKCMVAPRRCAVYLDAVTIGSQGRHTEPLQLSSILFPSAELLLLRPLTESTRMTAPTLWLCASVGETSCYSFHVFKHNYHAHEKSKTHNFFHKTRLISLLIKISESFEI